MPSASRSTAEQVAWVVKQSLQKGNSVEIDRLGIFRPVEDGHFEFIPNQRPTIFIAYVEEDLTVAEALYDAFEVAGMDPWMDRRNLLPGQNWPRAIERSIEMSDFFVAVLSRKSLVKKSIFQSEMRWALDCARHQPLDAIFFIPVRVHDCEVPWRISNQLQHVDLFPDFSKGVRRIVNMVQREHARRRKAA